MIYSLVKKKQVSSQGAPQENDAKFRYAIHPQRIWQFHDNCTIAKSQTVATLAPVYVVPMNISFYQYNFCNQLANPDFSTTYLVYS